MPANNLISEEVVVGGGLQSGKMSHIVRKLRLAGGN